MEATKDNCKTAHEIIELLSKKGCTVRQSEEILSYVREEIRDTATVQASN